MDVAQATAVLAQATAVLAQVNSACSLSAHSGQRLFSIICLSLILVNFYSSITILV